MQSLRRKKALALTGQLLKVQERRAGADVRDRWPEESGQKTVLVNCWQRHTGHRKLYLLDPCQIVPSTPDRPPQVLSWPRAAASTVLEKNGALEYRNGLHGVIKDITKLANTSSKVTEKMMSVATPYHNSFTVVRIEISFYVLM